MHESATCTLTGFHKFRLELHCWCHAVQLLGETRPEESSYWQKRFSCNGTVSYNSRVSISTFQISVKRQNPLSLAAFQYCIKWKASNLSSRKPRLVTWTSWDTTPLAATPQTCPWAYEKSKFYFLQFLHYWMCLSFLLHQPKTKPNLPTASDRAKGATG